MNKLNKLTKMAVVSLSLASTSIMSFANNNTDMQLNIDSNEDGKSSNISIYNASSSNSFELKLKIEGNVDFKSIDFSDHLKQNAILKSKYNNTSKILDITATSTVDLVKGGILNIGTLNIEGSDGTTYSIKDTNGITMVNSTYDEIKDNNLEEVGKTSITVGVKTELPEDNEEETIPPVEDTTPEDSTPGGTTPPSVDGGNNGNEDNNGDGNNNENEGTNKPSTDNIETSQSSDGTKLLIPKTKDALTTIINNILATDKDAKIVDIKEDSTYYLYRVKYKNNTRNNSTYNYVDIKVSKEISDKKELPGISVENTNSTPDNNNTGNNNNNNSGNNNTGNNNNNSGSNNTGNSNSGSNNTGSNSSGSNNNSNTSSDSNKKPQTGDFASIGYIATALFSASTLGILNKKKKK